MSRRRDSLTRRALVNGYHFTDSLANQHSVASSKLGERTPLLNSVGLASESLMNKSLGAAEIQTGVSWSVAAFLLVNTALGAGMLNYPYAYNQIGGAWVAALMQIVSFGRPAISGGQFQDDLVHLLTDSPPTDSLNDGPSPPDPTGRSC